MITNIDNFFFPADNLEESKNFYTQTLGLALKFDFSKKGMVAFKIGDQEPALILKDRIKFPNTPPALWLEVDDVCQLYTQLKKQGVHFKSEPFKIQTGWTAEFLDPSGNLLGITDYKTS